MNDEMWVKERLSLLEPKTNRAPDSGAALARLQRRERRRRSWQRRGWLCSFAALSAGFLVTISLPVPAKCALTGMGCPRLPILLEPLAAQAAAPTPQTKPAREATEERSDFKESGRPGAPVTIELYTDYECPACREFYLNSLPQLKKDFIDTGKVRLIHRDFPLPQHHFSTLATRYANASGLIGKYDVVARQLFETQPEWSTNGDVDGAVAKVLTPAEMNKVRNIVKTDTSLDESMVNDQDQGTFQDHIHQTPSIVFVYKGKREVVGGGMPYSILKSYLDKMLQ